jgi:hypothetical protein
MPLFLEIYTIPHDLPEQDLVYGLRRVNRGSGVTTQRCAYNLTAGRAWCLTEAPDEATLRSAVTRMEFAFTLDDVRPADSSDLLDRMAGVDRVFDPRATSPGDVGAAPRRT